MDKQISQYPKGDILQNYKNEQDPEKFSYLQAKYIFRFPFTVTAIKWGVVLGFFFGIHTYIKKRNLRNSLYWFASGTVLTGMSIWGFFMLKYCFYSVSLRKFEEEQHTLMQENNLIKEYLTKKANVGVEIDDDQFLAKQIQRAQRQLMFKSQDLDQFLTDGHMQDIENILNQ